MSLSFLDEDAAFCLPEAVRREVLSQPAPFGFGRFSEAVFHRTYARFTEQGRPETWGELVVRVIEGLFRIRKTHYRYQRLPWQEEKMQNWAAEMALMMHHLRWLPPGRGLWALGTEHVSRHGAAALCNCAAVNAEPLEESLPWSMDMLMLGVGVGFDTFMKTRPKGALDRPTEPIVIEDSREGWVDSIRALVHAHMAGEPEPVFDYSRLRLKGEPIRGFGGTASGPEPLKELHQRLGTTFREAATGKISLTRLAADSFNAVARCVVAGNVRRSAQLALGCPGDEDFLRLKNPEQMPERQDIAWLSNNTVRIEEGWPEEKLADAFENIRLNGEPGFFFASHVRENARMGDLRPDTASLCNPCAEIPLESMELCNLAEVFPTRCKNEYQLKKAIQAATFHAQTVSLLPTHSEGTNAIIAKNRRIGVSLSGIADWIYKEGYPRVKKLLDLAYQEVDSCSEALAMASGVPKPIRITTIKPSGTISLLAGVSPGMHWPVARHAIRRMRVASESPVAEVLMQGGIPYETDVTDSNTLVFEFPVAAASPVVQNEVSAFEQLSLLAMLQREYSDNMVSATITFDLKKEGRELESLMRHFHPQLKSVSFLPVSETQVWPQMPIEAISEEDWEKRVASLRSLDWSRLSQEVSQPERYCTGEHCQV